MTITYRNGVSIAEIAVYIPGLAVAMLLALRHGFRKNAGWYFLIVFCLARIIGGGLQLGTINDPKNQSLYEGSAILNNIGFTPLELAALGLLSRLIDNINKSHRTMISTRMLKFVELILLVSMILGIVGGTNAAGDYSKTGHFQPGSLNKVGTGLMIAAWALTVVATIMTSFSISHAEHGEKRLIVAIAFSLPFLAVRLVYSIFSTFTTNKHFNLLTGSPTVLLCVALIEEFIVVVLFEGVGLTLAKVEKPVEGTRVPSSDSAEHALPPQKEQQDNAALRFAKRTITGRLLMSMMPDKHNKDVEMQRR